MIFSAMGGALSNAAINWATNWGQSRYNAQKQSQVRQNALKMEADQQYMNGFSTQDEAQTQVMSNKPENPSGDMNQFFDMIKQGLGAGISTTIAQSVNDALRGSPGDRAAKYMNQLYPGTSSYERLKAGGGGAPSMGNSDVESRRQAALQTKLTKMQTDTQKEVAQTQQQTALGVAEINAGVSTRGQDFEYGVLMSPKFEYFMREKGLEIIAQALTNKTLSSNADIKELFGRLANDFTKSYDDLFNEKTGFFSPENYKAAKEIWDNVKMSAPKEKNGNGVGRTPLDMMKDTYRDAWKWFNK